MRGIASIEPLQKIFELGGKRHLKAHGLSASGMKEFHSGGVQEIPAEALPHHFSALQARRRAIKRVTDNRMAKRSKVDPQLVCAPGLRIGFDQCDVREAAKHPVSSDGFARAQAAGFHPHAAVGVAAHRAGDFAAGASDTAVNQKQVSLLHLARLELRGERAVREIVLGHDHEA